MSEPLIWRAEWILGIDLLDGEHRESVTIQQNQRSHYAGISGHVRS
ncbi:MAG: hypothetical protein WBG92_22340 [Thiohalocapsa sp.]